MKVQGSFNFSLNQIDNKKADTQPKNNFKKIDSTTSCPLEQLGRSQVSFGNSEKQSKLCENDEKFVTNLSKNLRLENEETEKLKRILLDYFKENNFKNLDDMGSDDFFNEQAELSERIIVELDLTEMNSYIVAHEMAIRTIDADDYEVTDERKYIADAESVLNICRKYDLKEESGYLLSELLEDMADEKNTDSVFELFEKEKNKDIKTDIIKVKKFLNQQFLLNEEDSNDLIIDLGKTAKLPQKLRVPFNSRQQAEKERNNGFSDFLVSSEITEKYNLNDNDANEIKSLLEQRKRKNDTETSTKGKKSTEEVAFLIMEKFNLSFNAYREIIEILKDYDNYSGKDLDTILTNKLMKGEQI